METRRGAAAGARGTRDGGAGGEGSGTARGRAAACLSAGGTLRGNGCVAGADMALARLRHKNTPNAPMASNKPANAAIPRSVMPLDADGAGAIFLGWSVASSGATSTGAGAAPGTGAVDGSARTSCRLPSDGLFPAGPFLDETGSAGAGSGVAGLGCLLTGAGVIFSGGVAGASRDGGPCCGLRTSGPGTSGCGAVSRGGGSKRKSRSSGGVVPAVSCARAVNPPISGKIEAASRT